VYCIRLTNIAEKNESCFQEHKALFESEESIC